MQRQRIERCGHSDNSRCRDDDIANGEQDADEFFQNRPADDLRHICDRVATRVGIAEVTLHQCAVCIQYTPANDCDSAWERA